MDIWNETIKIRDTYIVKRSTNTATQNKYSGIAMHASILLNQMNTAGGKELMRGEVVNFINKFGSVKK